MVETSKQLEQVAISMLRKYNGDIDKALPQFLQAVKKRIDDLAGVTLSNPKTRTPT